MSTEPRALSPAADWGLWLALRSVDVLVVIAWPVASVYVLIGLALADAGTTAAEAPQWASSVLVLTALGAPIFWLAVRYIGSRRTVWRRARIAVAGVVLALVPWGVSLAVLSEYLPLFG